MIFIALIIFYLLGLAFTAWLFTKAAGDDVEPAMVDALAILWPITLPFIVVGTVVLLVIGLATGRWR